MWCTLQLWLRNSTRGVAVGDLSTTLIDKIDEPPKKNGQLKVASRIGLLLNVLEDFEISPAKMKRISQKNTPNVVVLDFL